MLKTLYAAHAQKSRSMVYSDNAHETKRSKPTERLANHQPTRLPAFAAPTKWTSTRGQTSLTMRSQVPYGPRGVSHSRTMAYCERVTQLCYHAILEVRGGITHPHTRHTHSLAPIEPVLSRNLGCASLGWLQGNEIRPIIHDHQDVAKSILFRQTLTTFRSVAADIQKIEMDYPSRRSTCLLYTSPSPRDGLLSRMPSSA